MGQGSYLAVSLRYGSDASCSGSSGSGFYQHLTLWAITGVGLFDAAIYALAADRSTISCLHLPHSSPDGSQLCDVPKPNPCAWLIHSILPNFPNIHPIPFDLLPPP